MADLRFSEECDVAVEQLKDFAIRINSDIYGNGRQGLMEEVRQFLHTFRATEEERERQQKQMHQQNAAKLEEINANVANKGLLWTIAGVAWTIAGVVVAILALYIAVKVNHADLQHIFTSDLPPTYDARR